MRGSQGERLLDIFGTVDPSSDLLRPNLNHVLLSELVKNGYLRTIVTTNFDRLIEKALESRGLRSGRDYLIYHDEERFSRIDWTDPRPRIVKIHGSVEDRGAMRVIFEMVEAQGLSRPSLEVIRHLFSRGEHDDVLVLGYSSSDRFDLSPQIMICAADPKNVFYLDHSPKSGVEPIADKGNGNPFRLFQKGLRIWFDTDQLMRILWETFIPDQEYKLERFQSQWKDKVDEWNSGVLPPFDHLMAGNILRMAAEFNEATRRYEAVLIHARNAGDLRLQSDALGLLGQARQGLGQYALARTLYDESLAIAESLGEEGRTEWARSLLRNIPSAAAQDGAVLDLEEAVRDAKRRQRPREAGQLLINLGNARMVREEYDQALSCYERALDSLWGDSRAAAVIHNNMGMAYVKLGQYELGEFLYMVSLEMCRQLGDRQGEGTTRFLLGESYAARGEYKAARGSYEESLSIAESIEDDALRAQAKLGLLRANRSSAQEDGTPDAKDAAKSLIRALEQQNLAVNPEIVRWNEEAKLSFVLGQYDKGRGQFLEAYRKASTLMDRRGQIMTLNNMGIAAVGMNDHSSGLQLHEEALDLSRQIGDRDLEVSTLECLSRLYSHAAEPLKVIRYYEESIQRARVSGNRSGEIDYLNLLAKVYFNSREHLRAIDPLERALQASREAGDLRLQGVVLNNLGNIYSSLEQWDEAAGCFRRALETFESLHLDDSAAAAHSALNRVLGKTR